MKISKFILTAAVAATLLLASCKGKDQEYLTGRFVTVNVIMGTAFYFVDDEGKTYWPGDVSRVSDYRAVDSEGQSKHGRRAFIYFGDEFLPPRDGFDFNIVLHAVVDIASFDVELALIPQQVEEAGNERIGVTSAWINGDWLDTAFTIATADGTRHTITLLDNQTVEAPDSMPSGFEYLELRHSASDSKNTHLAGSYASFRLGYYSPRQSGSKGLFIRYLDLEGNVKYLQLPYSN